MKLFPGVVIFVCMALTGCSLMDKWKAFQNASSAQGAAPVVAPATAAAPVGTTPMDTFRALAPAEGLKTTPLFVEPLTDSSARFQRLEDSVQNLRNDFDTVVPSLVRLVSVERDMKELVHQLQTLSDTVPPANAPQEGMAAPDGTMGTAAAVNPVSTAPLPLTAAPAAGAEADAKPPVYWAAPNNMAATDAQKEKDAATANAAASPAAPAVVASPPPAHIDPVPPAPPPPPIAPPPQAAQVKEVRVGDHPDKTRVVLDVTEKSDFKVSLENNGQVVLIEIPQADWSAIKPYDALSAALVAGWRVEGNKLKMELMYPASVKSQELLPPKDGSNYRLVIDLFSKDVHQ